MKMLLSIRSSFVALGLGLVLALSLVALVGENPLLVLKILVMGSMGGLREIAYSLFYATPLILTGLSVAWAF